MSRFVECRLPNKDILILDLRSEPVVVCRCEGFMAPLQAEYIIAALNHYHSSLMDKFDATRTTPDITAQ